MDDNIELHWYLITTSFGNTTASMYKGVPDKKLTMTDLDSAKDVNNHPRSAFVDGVFYLGKMTKEVFKGGA